MVTLRVPSPTRSFFSSSPTSDPISRAHSFHVVSANVTRNRLPPGPTSSPLTSHLSPLIFLHPLTVLPCFTRRLNKTPTPEQKGKRESEDLR